MIATATALRGSTVAMNQIMRKARSVILYGSAIGLGLVLCSAWFAAGLA